MSKLNDIFKSFMPTKAFIPSEKLLLYVPACIPKPTSKKVITLNCRSLICVKFPKAKTHPAPTVKGDKELSPIL